jgi:hypothetical protein
MKRILLCLALAVFFAGCAASHYDPVAGPIIEDLVVRTNEVAKDGDHGRLSLRESRRFLRQSKAMVGVVRARGDAMHMSADTQTVLESADRSYDALLERKAPLRSAAVSGLMTTLVALHEMLPVRNFVVEAAATSALPDDTDTTSADCKKKKECDDRHAHHDHDDRKDRDDHHCHDDQKDRDDHDDHKDHH